MTESTRPSGVQVRLAGGGFADIDDSAIRQAPEADADGLTQWIVQVPANIDYRYPPELRIGKLPGRTSISIEFAVTNDQIDNRQ